MDRASIVILERTLELATELMPDDVRVANCMDAIRHYVESPDVVSEQELHHAVAVGLGHHASPTPVELEERRVGHDRSGVSALWSRFR